MNRSYDDDRGYGGRDRYEDRGGRGGYRGGGRDERSARVYVGNLPDDIHRDELYDFVGKYGRVLDVDVKYGKTSNQTAYAFVTFEDDGDADECIRRRDGAKFQDGDRTLRVRVERAGRDKRRTERGPPRRSDFRAFVTGLPRSASWQDLKDMFRSVGDVGYANIDRDVGVVEFHDRRDLDEAIRQMDGKEFMNGPDKINVSATPPEGFVDSRGGHGGHRGGRRDERSLSPRRRSPSPRRRSRSRSLDRRDRERPRSRSPPPRREASPYRDDEPRRSASPPRRERDDESARGRSRSRSPAARRSRSPPRRSHSRD